MPPKKRRRLVIPSVPHVEGEKKQVEETQRGGVEIPSRILEHRVTRPRGMAALTSNNVHQLQIFFRVDWMYQDSKTNTGETWEPWHHLVELDENPGGSNHCYNDALWRYLQQPIHIHFQRTMSIFLNACNNSKRAGKMETPRKHFRPSNYLRGIINRERNLPLALMMMTDR